MMNSNLVPIIDQKYNDVTSLLWVEFQSHRLIPLTEVEKYGASIICFASLNKL